MTSLQDPAVRDLLQAPNHATVCTFAADGSIHSAVAWISLEDGELAVNSAEGRVWPTNLERDPRITVVVPADGNPYEYVEVRGTTRADRDDADDHIDRLAKKFIGEDKYPFRQPGEVRIKFVIEPERVRYQKQG
jgi:PPOX class probable F420-dependent enzyme